MSKSAIVDNVLKQKLGKYLYVGLSKKKCYINPHLGSERDSVSIFNFLFPLL